MDVHKALAELYEEKRRLDAAIVVLQTRLLAPQKVESNGRARRGRRSMGEKEREEVSLRMSRYWAARRAQKTAVPEQGMPLQINPLPGTLSSPMMQEGA